MTVRLYDTKAQALRDFVPLDPENVTIYVCGPTVQSGPHIGHLRGALSFDILRRWLELPPARVTFVRNVTDIDDKVLVNATRREPWWALAYRMELEFSRVRRDRHPPPDLRAARDGVHPADAGAHRAPHRARARLRGRAAGRRVLRRRSWPAYGELTRQSLDAMEPRGGCRPPRQARPPRLRALEGRQGRRARVGDVGLAVGSRAAGLAHRVLRDVAALPRRRSSTSTAADSTCASRTTRTSSPSRPPPATRSPRYWVHNGLVTVGDQKMSKSLGNFSRRGRARRARPARRALRARRRALPLEPRHHARRRSTRPRRRSIASAASSSAPAARSREARVRGALGATPCPTRSPRRWTTTSACRRRSRCSTTRVRDGNTALDDGDLDDASRAFAAGHRDDRHPRDRPARRRVGRSAATGAAESALDALVQTMITQRADARAAKDWAAADRIRDAIAAAGIALEDTADGTHWSHRRWTRSKTGQAGRPGASKAARRAPRRAPGARTSAPSRVADRHRRPRTAPGTPRASARPRGAAMRRRRRQGQARRVRSAPASRAPRAPRRTTTPRWSPAATRCSRRCAPRSRRPRSTSRSASRWTTASRRCCRSRRTARSR